MFLVVLIIYPLIIFLGLILGWLQPGKDIGAAILSLGGETWKVIIGFFFLIAGWTTNNGNLYSATVAISSIPIPKNDRTKTIILGLLGTALSTIPLSKNYEAMLGFMCISISAIGATILARYSMDRFSLKIISPNHRIVYYAIIFLSIFIGLLSQTNLVSISGYGFFDSFISAAMLVVLFELFLKKSNHELHFRY